MSVKFFILIILLIILISLGSALFHLIRGKSTGESPRRSFPTPWWPRRQGSCATFRIPSSSWRMTSTGEQMARALTIRVGLSVLLIAFIVVAAALGWISPHGAIPVVPRAGG